MRRVSMWRAWEKGRRRKEKPVLRSVEVFQNNLRRGSPSMLVRGAVRCMNRFVGSNNLRTIECSALL